MSNTMAAHEPINYLDSILSEEEKRCEYGHQWRNFTISRSGRFKSKNKKRDIVDGKLFDRIANSSSSAASSSSSPSASSSATTTKDDRNSCNSFYKEQEKYSSSRKAFGSGMQKNSYQQPFQQQQQNQTPKITLRDKNDICNRYYETNL